MEERTAPKKKRGFTALSPDRRREVAALGGKTAQQRGTAHRWTKEEAQQAGRKGGLTRRRRKTSMSPPPIAE